jgi:hypothetical protein
MICASILLLGATSSWCGKRVTVGQLEDMLRTMQQEKRSDAEIATALKQLDLSQELTPSTMNRLINYAPGPLSKAQIFVLEGCSAVMIPPESDLPATPVPDVGMQMIILQKALAYVTDTYAQLPRLIATKTTLRFQDNFEALGASSGLQNGAKDATVNAGFSNPANFVHYINASQSQVLIEHGAEKLQPESKKTAWGANKMIALLSLDPSLLQIVREAETAQTLQWLRWESINGKPAAVFTFVVPHERSELDVQVCCFPKIDQTGVATFYTATSAPLLNHGGNEGGVSGNFQTSTRWYEYKSAPPFHGELFIDVDTGVVVRMIVEAEFPLNAVVHQLDTRIDFAPVKPGDKLFVVPVKTYINSVVVPNGDSGAATYTTRRTLFTSEFADYKLPN